MFFIITGNQLDGRNSIPADTEIFIFFHTLYVPYLYSAYPQYTCIFI